MKQKPILYVVWILSCVTLVYFTISSPRETTRFKGISENREIVVNTEKPVEIACILVVPGQAVTKGQLLVELCRPELILRINEITHQIIQIKMEHRMKEIEINSQIKGLMAERTSKASEISYRIKQVRSRQALNRALAENLESLNVKSRSSGRVGSLSTLELEALEKENELAMGGIDLKIGNLKETLEAIGTPLTVHIQSLENELAMLNTEKEKLHIFSDFEAIIGSVHFRTGEKVTPFEPILSLHPRSPSYVSGYIPEDVYNRVALGQAVWVQSITSPDTLAPGEVVGVGARIVEFPERLRVRPVFPVWGREVQIKIEPDNSLLLGEKVMVTVERPAAPELVTWIGNLMLSAYGME
ncbi:MAG: hypothetical protein V1793_04350 [Pseudomonadota bacterium]